MCANTLAYQQYLFQVTTRLINNVTGRAKELFTLNRKLPVRLLVMGWTWEIKNIFNR